MNIHQSTQTYSPRSKPEADPPDEHERLGSKSINRLLLEFSIPATIGMVINAMYNIVDRIFIGRDPNLSTTGLAALTIAFPIMMIMSGISILFGGGGGAIYSIRLGEHNTKGAEEVLGNVITMITLTSMVATGLGLWQLEAILSLFGASDTVMPYAVEYMRIILFASLSQGLSLGFNHFMRADGSPRSSMISMMIGAGFNAIFNYIFIYILGLGMTGCALATIGGQTLATIWGLTYFLFRSQIRLRLKNMFPNLALITRIMVTGLPVCCTHISNSLLNIVLNKQIGFYGGDIAVSSIGIISSLNQFVILPITGIHHGAQPIIGYNRGSGNYARIKETYKKSVTAATVYGTLIFLITRTMSRQIIEIFGSNQELIAFGSQAVQKWFLFLPVVGFQTITALYFQAVGKPKTSLLLTFTRQLVLLIPMIFILGKYFGVEGILYAAPVTDGIAFLLTLSFVPFEMRRLNNLQSR